MLGCLSVRSRLLPAILLTASLVPFSAIAAEPAAVGVGNFHRVSRQVYRGAQPTAAGIHSLANLGVKTVIDLRESGKRALWEKKLVESAGMRYINVPLSGIGAPPPAKVKEILALFDDSSSGPVFVHCRRGADRTGTLVACYRIVHDKWDNGKALEEARSLGMHWFEFAMKNYVLSYRPATPEAVVSAIPTATVAVN